LPSIYTNIRIVSCTNLLAIFYFFASYICILLELRLTTFK